MATCPRLLLFLFLLPWRHPISTLFPYTTLFRSDSISRSFDYFFDEDGVNYATGEVSRAASLAIWSNDFATGLDRRLVGYGMASRSEEHTSELQSREKIVCRLLLEKKKT